MNVVAFYLTIGALCGSGALLAEAKLLAPHERDLSIPILAFFFWPIALAIFVMAFTEGERNRTVYHKRRKARAQGETLPKLDKRVARQERRTADAAAMRRDILEEVDAKWAELGTVGFRVWLRRELRALREKAVA